MGESEIVPHPGCHAQKTKREENRRPGLGSEMTNAARMTCFSVPSLIVMAHDHVSFYSQPHGPRHPQHCFSGEISRTARCNLLDDRNDRS
jgi:hypothetical protein